MISNSHIQSQSWRSYYLLSRLANPEDNDQQTGWKQLPNEEDGTEGQVAFVSQLTVQVSLQESENAGSYFFSIRMSSVWL